MSQETIIQNLIDFIESETENSSKYQNIKEYRQGWRLLVLKHNTTKKFLPVVKRTPYYLKTIIRKIKDGSIKNKYLKDCFDISNDFCLYDCFLDSEVDCIKTAEKLVEHYRQTDLIMLDRDTNFFFPELPSELREIIDGCVAGDGSISRSDHRTSRFSIGLGFRQKEHLEELKSELEKFGYQRTIFKIKPNENKNPGYGLHWTLRVFNLERERWYYEGRKRLPLDLKNSKNFWRWFYAGDGSLGTSSTFKSYIRISSDDLIESDVERLVEMLQQLNIKANKCKAGIGKDGKRQWTVRISTTSTRDFLEYIGPPVKSLEYKWELKESKSKQCEVCLKYFTMKRISSNFCSLACQKKNYSNKINNDIGLKHKLKEYKRLWYLKNRK